MGKKSRQKEERRIIGGGMRAFQEELELLLRMHFPGMKGESEDEDLACEKCVDLKLGVCEGSGLKGSEVITRCFSEKMQLEIAIV